MNIIDKHFAYLLESTSSKKKQVPLLCGAFSTKVKDVLVLHFSFLAKQPRP